MIPFGGWTPRFDGDPCRGGHVMGTWTDEHGFVLCCRCGRLVDRTPCWCGDHEPGDQQGRSYCQRGVREDQRALDVIAYHLDEDGYKRDCPTLRPTGR